MIQQVAIGLTANKVPIYLKEWQGERVVTIQDIAAVHELPRNTVQKAFQRHSHELCLGKDYFELAPSEAQDFKAKYQLDNLSMSKKSGINGLKLFTEYAYLVLACTFSGEKAARIRHILIESYFTCKNLAEAVPAPVSVQDSVMMKHNEILERQNEILDRLTNVIGSMVVALNECHHREVPPAAEIPATDGLSLPACNPLKRRDGEMTLAEIAEAANWFTPGGEPHIKWAAAVARDCGIYYKLNTENEMKYTRNVLDLVNGEIRQRLYIKPEGVERIAKWCEKHNDGKDYQHIVYYQRSVNGHIAGDIRDSYYAIPGVKPTKYKLAAF